MQSPSIITLVFAKYPEPGQVMTRLCPPLSLEQAARVQRILLRHIWSVASRWGGRCTLVGSPDNSADEFRELLEPSILFWRQGDGDLGDRLSRASRRAFDAGALGVVFLGADHPALNPNLIDRTADLFTDTEVVIGPAEDGGYYLLAVRGHYPTLYQNIDWGTQHVLNQTLDRARDSGLRVRLLETSYDVDRFDDLRRAISDLDAQGASDVADQLREAIAPASGG